MPKKIVLVGLLAFMLVVSVAPSLQAMDNIKLEVNGDVVTNNLSYQLKDQNILIPLGILTKALPLKMRWYESIQTLQLQLSGRTVKLRLGDKRLQVNNQLLRMPVAVERKNGEFMIPLQTLSDALGLMIRADQAARVVKIYQIDAQVEDVSYISEEGYQGVKVQTTNPVEPKIDYLNDPERIILDLPAATLGQELKKIKEASKLIKGVRVAQFDATTVRVVVDLTGKAHYRLISNRSGRGYSYLIKINPVIKKINYTSEGLKITGTGQLQTTTPAQLTDPQRVMVDIKNAVLADAKEFTVDDADVKKIKVSQYKTDPNPVVRAVLEVKRELDLGVVNEQKELLLRPIRSKLKQVVYNSNQPKQIQFSLTQQQPPRGISLQKGARLVFDFPNTENNFSKNKIPVNNNLIEEIRVSQFDQNTTRVVVDLTELVHYQTSWVEGQFNVKLMNKLQQIKAVDSETELELDISLVGEGSYQVYKLHAPQRLVVDVEETIVDKEDLDISNDSRWVRDIRVSQYRLNPNITRVVLDLKENFDFAVQSPDSAQQIAVKVNERTLAGKVVVLDPGHGGKDPGALGAAGTKEKKVVLEIAHETRKLLEKAGAKVVMTRSKDEFIALEKRVEIVNDLEPDLFVSIHANGYQTNIPDGTETFVEEGSGQQSQFLAQCVQQELIKKLDTYDRQVKEDGLYVLEHSTVPAILSEVAFITNPKQEKLLTDEEFRFEAAVGLYEGISKYFKWLAEEES